MRPSGAKRWLIVLMLCSLSLAVSAHERYLRDVPSKFGCTTCHGDPRVDRQGPNFRNGFGFDYVFQQQDWSQLCRLDSDGDGITNAVELADPTCAWRSAPVGQPNTALPTGAQTHPGDADDPNQCGDRVIQGSEFCDGFNLGDQTCASLGYVDGVLGCQSDCTFDESQCIEASVLDMHLPTTDMAALADQFGPLDATSDLSSNIDATPDVDTELSMDTTVVSSDDIGSTSPDASPADTAFPMTADAGAHPIPTGVDETGTTQGCRQSTSRQPIILLGILLPMLLLRRCVPTP